MEQLIHRVLVVDDEPLIRNATSRAMSAQSFCCDTASDGREAMQVFREHRHELVITDLRMPKFHGHSLILELLNEQDPPNIVVLTGVANSRLVRELFNRGVQDIVHKPVDFQVFAAKMLSLFERGNWNPSLGKGQTVQAGGNHHPLIHKIETALEIFGLCIPSGLDRQLSADSDSLNDPPASLVQFFRAINGKAEQPS